jgi:two-component system NtrC family response regulator
MAIDWKILVVDDEFEICRTLRNYFKLSGFNVFTATSGSEALEIIQKEKIHIVLSDIKMPEMDGLELLEKIHNIDFSIQVIMITGFSTFSTTLQALEKGAADYILKPFDDMDEIVKIVNLSIEKLSRWKANLAASAKRKPSTDA